MPFFILNLSEDKHISDIKYQNVKTAIETSKTLLEDSDNSDIIM